MGKIYIGPSDNKVIEAPAVAVEQKTIYVDRPIEVVKEVIVEKIVEIPVEKIVEVSIPVETIKEVIVEKPVEIIKIVEKQIEVPVEIIKEVTKEVIKVEYIDRIKPIERMPSYVPVLAAALLIESIFVVYLILHL
jgi:hypothetical protein